MTVGEAVLASEAVEKGTSNVSEGFLQLPGV